MSSNLLSFPNRLTGRRVSLALVADGKLLSLAELRAQIQLSLELIKGEKFFFARQSPRFKHSRQEALPRFGSILVEYPPCVQVRLMFRCVAFACQRLASWSCAELVMERVTRGRVSSLVKVRMQRRACCAVRCSCCAAACVHGVFDACCSKCWLVLRSVDAHPCIKRAAAFILVSRLLLPPALQADPTFWTRQNTETALRCFAM
jgi:hypothetical protein